MQLVKRYGKKGAMVVLASLSSVRVFAAPPDFSTLTTGIDFSTAITAILAAMAALAGVYIVMKGGQLILSAIRK